jgi:hypothetical protein
MAREVGIMETTLDEFGSRPAGRRISLPGHGAGLWEG